MGRDIMHHMSNGHVRLIQCKNLSASPSPSAIGEEMAKVYVNVHTKKIPQKPDEVVFFVSTDLKAKSQDLIESQDKWKDVADKHLAKYLKKNNETPSEELKDFARGWWPFGDRSAGIVITQDIQLHYPKLIDQFFDVKKVIEGGIDEIRNIVREENVINANQFSVLIEASKTESEFVPNKDCSPDEILLSFTKASKFLSQWPRTLGDSKWIERPELESILGRVKNQPHGTCILLGEPGCGKSALLAHLLHDFEKLQIPYLGIKADQISTKVSTEGKLSERMNLPALVTDCVKTIALTDKVVVVIDQLDALADLVDLHSERLNVLLNLINHLSEIPNVFIVASSRIFEFHHDARFHSINADHVELQLPSWEQVTEILVELDIDSSKWPETFREVLRIPQNLKLFVEHLCGKEEQHVYESYQEMLEGLWSLKVTKPANGSERSQLLDQIATEMSDREELWLPLALFDSSRAIVDELVSDGILTYGGSNRTIGFQHQTLFSHARARAIAKGVTDLYDYVFDRQNALFVRPTLWSTLVYLRSVSKQVYQLQINKLCSGQLRLHIQHLIMDFLGQLNDPDDFEEVQFVNWLEDDDFRRRAIRAISMSEGWFQRFKDQCISEFLQESGGLEWELVGLLVNAISRNPSDTIELLKSHWLNDTTKDELSIRIFDHLTEWAEERVKIVCRMIERSTLSQHHVSGIASVVSEYEPDLAPRILGTQFRKDLQHALTKDEPTKPDLPECSSIADHLAAKITLHSNDAVRKLLEANDGLYNMPEIAKAAPHAFLSEFWPMFIDAIEPTLTESHHIYRAYRLSRSVYFDFDNDSHRHMPLFDALQDSLKELGNGDIVAFENFVRNAMQIDSMLVQRLLCRALVDIKQTPVEFALEYLIGDPRRLAIGDHVDHPGDSRRLIAKISRDLNQEQIILLDEAINKWSEYHAQIPDEDANTRFSRRKWDRELKLRLRAAIPFELMTQSMRSNFEAEKVALHQTGLEIRNSRAWMSQVESPMSAEQMAKAADHDILKLFDELTDQTEWNHPRRPLQGGCIEASRELAEMTKKRPDRGIVLAKQFRREDQQMPVSYIVRGLGESEISSDEFFKLITELDSLGFDSHDFRDAAAIAFGKRLDHLDGLPDEICDLLTSWLVSWKYSEPTSQTFEGDDKDKEGESSILFDLSSLTSIPHGSYSILNAIAYGLMRKKPPSSDNWLVVLEDHLEREDDPRTWQVHAYAFPMLWHCDQYRSVAFLQKFFEKYPSVRDSCSGVMVVAKLRDFLGETVFIQFCNQLEVSEWVMGKQAKGELIGLSYLVQDGYNRVDTEVLESVHLGSQVDAKILKGIAFMAANLWKEVKCRPRATELFEVLSKHDDEQISSALAEVFLFAQFKPNRYSRRILHATLASPQLIQNVSAHHFADLLSDFVGTDPKLVLDLSNALLDQLDADQEQVYRRNFDISDAAFNSIAMALQRMGEPLRSQGLDLFERILTLGFSAPAQALRELDSRPVNVVKPVRRRRRTRN
ncbi:AAA family ATPase [Rubinisphaera italica]|nr:ATP-binding protein [Rubinisphaera italica]